MRNILSVPVLLLLIGCAEWSTKYSRADLPEKFQLVEIGQRVDEVYATIGPPLAVYVNRDLAGHGAYRLESLTTVEASTVKTMSEDTNKVLYLRYSGPKKAGDSYLLYSVEVREGKVVEKSGPLYLD